MTSIFVQSDGHDRVVSELRHLTSLEIIAIDHHGQNHLKLI